MMKTTTWPILLDRGCARQHEKNKERDLTSVIESLLAAYCSLREVLMSEFLLELWSFMKERKKFWLLPIIICLVLLGGLVVFTSGSAVAPFIYTLF